MSRNLTQSIEEALYAQGLFLHRGHLALHDALSAPQPSRRRRRCAAVSTRKTPILKHGADTRELDIDFQGKIVVGKFVEQGQADLPRSA